jgi:hypothetical protein
MTVVIGGLMLCDPKGVDIQVGRASKMPNWPDYLRGAAALGPKPAATGSLHLPTQKPRPGHPLRRRSLEF